MNIFKLLAIITAIAALSGCAHQIQLNPNTDSFVSSDKIINTTVTIFQMKIGKKL